MRKRKSPANYIVAALATCPSLATAAYTEPPSLQLPEISYDRLGDVFLAGSFDGISQLSYKGQAAMLVDPSSASDDLIVQYGSDVYTRQAFANGLISTSCTMGDNETVIVAGNFTSIFNHSIPNGLAAVNFTSQSAYALTNQSDGQGLSANFLGSQVNSLWCNGTQAYAGGSFKFGDSFGAALWDQRNNTWALPAFGGFTANASVNSIIEYNNNLVFGGNFSGIAPPGGRTNSTNSSMRLKPGMQPVSFNLANATGFEYSGASAENASSILCPYSENGGWNAGLDSTTGRVDIALAYMSQPTRIRLFNLPDGSGTKTFRIISEPAGSFMNLTYTDESGDEQSCAAFCPLPEYNDTIRYTDFKFVNVVPTSNLSIDLLDFYGTHAGLKGVELFEAGQFAFANNAFDYPRQCSDNSGGGVQQTSSSATAELTGSTWNTVNDFMSTNITDKSKLTHSNATFVPNFSSYAVDRGLYEVLLYTPGCQQYGTCSERGIVNVTVYPGFGVPQNTVLYQTNEELKYDLVYNGTMRTGSYISIVPTADNNVPMSFVAYKVSLNYLGSPEVYNASKLFEYSVTNFTSGSTESLPVGSTQINALGEGLGSNASVNALLLDQNNTLIVGGSGFPSNVSDSANLFSLSLGTSESSTQGVASIKGVSSSESVREILAINQTTFVLASNSTYRLDQGSQKGSQSASSLGIGAVSTVVPFSYNDTQYWMFSPGSNSSSDSLLNASFWDPSTSSIRTSGVPVEGRLTGAFGTQNVTLYTGSLRVADTYIANGAAILSENSAEFPDSPAFSVKAAASRLNSELSLGSQNSSGISGALYAGTYLNSSHIAVVGHFNATGSDNSTVANAVAISSSGTSALLGDEFDLDAGNTSFYSVVSSNGTTVVGGSFEGKRGSQDVQAVAVLGDRAQSQPKPLDPGGRVEVQALLMQPNTSNVVVGGDFVSADGVSNASCNGLCIYSLNSSDWTLPPNLGLDSGSVVSDLVFETGTKLVLGGQFSASNSKSQVAVYDFGNETLTPLPGLPGPVSSLVVLSNSTQNAQYAASGQNGSSVFIKWYDGSSKAWKDVPDMPLQPNSKVSALSVVMLSNNTQASSGSPFNSSKALLVSGALNISEGPVSSIVFDGQRWVPLYGTTSRTSDSNGIVQAVFAQYGGDLKGGVAYQQATATTHPRPSSSPRPSHRPPPKGQEYRHREYMARGHVVGIACGIGLCCVLVLMLLYMLAEYAFAKGSRTFAYQNLAQSRSAADKMHAKAL